MAVAHISFSGFWTSVKVTRSCLVSILRVRCTATSLWMLACSALWLPTTANQSTTSQGCHKALRPSSNAIFSRFHPSFDRTFTRTNIATRWCNTGIVLFEPGEMLKIFEKRKNDESESSKLDDESGSHRNGCLGSPSISKTIRRIVYQVAPKASCLPDAKDLLDHR